MLVAAFNAPTQRQILVSRIEEMISLQRDSCVEFSTNQYPNIIHPEGYQYLKKFERTPLPRTVFQIGHQQIAKTVYMLYGSNTTIVEYENIGTGTYKLKLKPDGSFDDELRPNQIYVLSLPFSLLQPAVEKRIFKSVQEALYTPLGLRTLESGHVDFKPIYKGDQWNRDTAYHQGTVWPFLLGDYFLAQLKIFKYSKKVQKEVQKAVEVLENHFYSDDCINGISEIFDGLEPSEGRGTVQQAWSISGLLQVFYKLKEVAEE